MRAAVYEAFQGPVEVLTVDDPAPAADAGTRTGRDRRGGREKRNEVPARGPGHSAVRLRLRRL